VLLKLHQVSGGSAGDIELTDSIFGISEVNKIAIAQVIRWQLHKRSGHTSYTKTRSDVRGSGKKIYRQKGTGNARHSDKYAPQFRKGGVAHGPKAVQWTMSVPKKVKKLALKHVFSVKHIEEKLIFVDSLHFDTLKTKEAVKVFAQHQGKKVLFIDIQEKNSFFVKSISNIVGFNYLPVVGLNVYDILRADVVIVSKNAVEHIEKRLLV
jgi:large subunit ribosomal protein L4